MTYEVLGLETAACCLAHRKSVRWIPSPGWWIHADNRSCAAMWDMRSPIMIIRHDQGRSEVVYPLGAPS